MNRLTTTALLIGLAMFSTAQPPAKAKPPSLTAVYITDELRNENLAAKHFKQAESALSKASIQYVITLDQGYTELIVLNANEEQVKRVLRRRHLLKYTNLAAGAKAVEGPTNPLLRSVAILTPPEPTTKQPNAWRLAFHRGHDIWVANADGSHQRTLIKNGECPCWSPDKSKIAFQRGNAIWVAWADGSHQRKVTSWQGKHSDDLSWDVGITWGASDPYLVHSRHELVKIVKPSPSEIHGSSIFSAPLWRPNGFEDDVFQSLAIQDPYAFAQNGFPAFDRSGKYLAYTRNGDVWLATRLDPRFIGPHTNLSISGSAWNNYRLEAAAEYDDPNDRASRENYGVTHLSWAPNGKTLAYGIQRIQGSGFWQVHLLSLVADKDGTLHVAQNRTLTADGCYPTFSPDGKTIAYFGETDNAGLDGIKLIPVAGGSSTVLIRDADEPAW